MPKVARKPLAKSSKRFIQRVIHVADGDFLHYSFITLTTTGYGEILPVSPSARLFASLQSVTGTLYLAVFIAALLGRSNDSADSESQESLEASSQRDA